MIINANNIKLDERFNYYFEKVANEELSQLAQLKPTSKINIFVGANNSGKSLFMRLLSTTKDFLVETSIIEFSTEINIFFKNLNKWIQHSINNIMIDSYPISQFLSLTKRLEDSFSFQEFSEFLSIIESTKDYLSHFSQINENSPFRDENFMGSPNISTDTINKIVEKSTEGLKIVEKILEDCKGLESKDTKRFYIPVLRGLRPLDKDFTDFYKLTTEKDYFANINHKPNVFTGLDFYNELKNLLLGNNEKRRLVQNYQKFISENLFEGKPVELIPSQDKNTVMVKIGDEYDREIHLLGDGIQSTIILTFKPFITKEPTYFFIEEPEMYLHAGLQRKILDFFNSEICKDHKFFMTTHSNHFLDLTIDIKEISIFTFRKQLENSEAEEKYPNFIVEAVDGANESSLELLGVRNSSVFLVNATIWVEGITDRWYLRKMLESYMEQDKVEKKLEEDVHYCFVEYGGSNITHWSFLDEENYPIEVERLCSKAMLVVDKDGDSKLERKKQLKAKLANRLIILPCREIENSLNYEVIKSVVAKYEEKDESILPDFTYEDFKDEYLGNFIHEKILQNKRPKRKGGYKSDSGTIKDKRIFCERTLDKIEFSKLPNSTQKEVEKIYNFILKQNS